MPEQWKIDELVVIAQKALSYSAYNGQRSGRIRETPDRRTIRYYTTMGLLDGPLVMHGRTAYYGRRHVLQLVAIKRLQSRGLPLMQIQQSLSGIDDNSLAHTANVPDEFWPHLAKSKATEVSQPSMDLLLGTGTEKQGAPFWLPSSVSPVSFDSLKEQAADPAVPCPTVQLPLAQGVTLVVEGSALDHWNKESLIRLAPAVRQFLRRLRLLGLVPEVELGVDAKTMASEANLAKEDREVTNQHETI